MRRKNAVRRAYIGAAAVVFLLATGCDSSGDDKSAKPTASATQSKEQEERAAAESAALAAYRGMWDAQVEAYASGSMKNAKLGDYTTGSATTKIINTSAYYQHKGFAITGKPKLAPKVTAVDIESASHTATISDCVDLTDYVLVRRATGEPVTVDKGDSRRPWTAKAVTAKGGREWRIADYTIHKDRTC